MLLARRERNRFVRGEDTGEERGLPPPYDELSLYLVGSHFGLAGVPGPERQQVGFVREQQRLMALFELRQVAGEAERADGGGSGT